MALPRRRIALRSFKGAASGVLTAVVTVHCTFPDFVVLPRAVEPSAAGTTAGIAAMAGSAATTAGAGASASGSGGATGGGAGNGGGGTSSAGESTSGNAGTSQAGGEGGAPDLGPPGTGLRFEGNQLVRFGPAPTDDLTIELWVSTSSQVGSGQWHEGAALFNADKGGIASDFGAAHAGDYFVFGTGNPDVTARSTTKINTGSWLHLAATREMTTGIISVYVGGKLEASVVTGNKGPLVDAQPPSLGATPTADGFFGGFVGMVDEVRLWNVVRTEQELASNLHVRLTGSEPGLVGYWRLDEGEGLVAVDSSPLHNDGMLGNELVAPPLWVEYGPPALP